MAQGINHKPAFNWWALHILKKRDRTIVAACSRKAWYLKRSCKFGIAVLRSVEDAYTLNKEHDNTFWADAIAKEIEAVRVAFKVMGDRKKPPPGCKDTTLKPPPGYQ